MLVDPVSVFFGPDVADGDGVMGIVMAGEALPEANAGADAATARSLCRHATTATAITTMTPAISATRARDRDRSTGWSPQGRRVPPYACDRDTHRARTYV